MQTQTTTTDRLNNLHIRQRPDGKVEIDLRTPRGGQSGWTWTGSQLKHTTGQTMRFNDEISAAIAQAITEVRPAIFEAGCDRYTVDQGCPLHGETCGSSIATGASRKVADAVTRTVAFAKTDLEA